MNTTYLSRKRLLIIGGVIVLLLILFAWLVNWQTLLRLLRQNDWRYWFGGVVLLLVGYAFNLVRWHYLLVGNISWLSLFHGDSVAYMLNMITPMPIMVSRVVTTGWQTPVSIPEATSAMVVDRLLENLMRAVTLILVLALAAAQANNAHATTTILEGVGLFAVAVVVLPLLARHRETVAAKLSVWLGRLPRLNEAKIRATLDNLFQGLAYSGETRHLVIGIAISLVMWTCFLGFQSLVLLGIPPRLASRQTLVIAGVVLAIIPPSTPAMIALYQSVVIGTLVALNLMEINTAAAYSILLFLPQIVFWLLMGGWTLLRTKVSFSQLVQAIGQQSGSSPLNASPENVSGQ